MFFVLTTLGAVIGAPRKRSMAILALAGFIGGCAGTFVYIQGVDFIFFIKEPKREVLNYLCIDTDNKTATVYVPVFTDSKGAALDVYDGSEIFGNATYEIIDTEYGKAMKVTATGNILISTKHPDGAKKGNSEEQVHEGFWLEHERFQTF